MAQHSIKGKTFQLTTGMSCTCHKLEAKNHFTYLFSWQDKPMEAKVYWLTANLTFTFQKTEVNDHPVSIKVNTVSPFVVAGVPDQNYCYKSVATHFYVAGWALISYTGWIYLTQNWTIKVSLSLNSKHHALNCASRGQDSSNQYNQKKWLNWGERSDISADCYMKEYKYQSFQPALCCRQKLWCWQMPW